MKREHIKNAAGIVLIALGLWICNEIGLLVACVGAAIISK